MSIAQPSFGQLPSDSSRSMGEFEGRHAEEAAGLAKARASVAAGRVVDGARVMAWMDSLGTDNELPAPHSYT